MNAEEKGERRGAGQSAELGGYFISMSATVSKL